MVAACYHCGGALEVHCAVVVLNLALSEQGPCVIVKACQRNVSDVVRSNPRTREKDTLPMLDWKNRFARLGRSSGPSGGAGRREGNPLLLVLAVRDDSVLQL